MTKSLGSRVNLCPEALKLASRSYKALEANLGALVAMLDVQETKLLVLVTKYEATAATFKRTGAK